MKSKKFISSIVILVVAVFGGIYLANGADLMGSFGSRKADLVVNEISVEETTGFLNIAIWNVGSRAVGSAIAGYTYVYIEDMSNPAWTYAWSTLDDQNFRTAGSFSILQPEEINDIYTVKVCVDATSVVRESDETNNCLTEVVEATDASYVTRGSFLNDTLVDAGYTLDECTGGLYPDVDEEDEYCSAIETASNEGLIEGYTDETFEPDDSVTRGQGAKLAYIVYGISEYTPASPSFDDISGAWYETYIESLNAVGAFEYNTGSFHPDEALTQYALDIWMSNL